MATVYRTTGGWGAGKGSNLTPAEVDENFFGHEGRINTIETSPPQPNDITNITTSGSQFTVHMGDGSTFGPFTLPTAVVRFRGEYAAGETYFELDLVSVASQGLFLVQSFHIAAATFDPLEEQSDGLLYFQVFGTSIVGSLDEILDVEFDSGGLTDGDVLTWRTDQWVSEPSSTPIVLSTSAASLTLLQAHANRYIRFTNNSAITVTVPADGVTDFTIGTEIHLRQSGGGAVTVSGAPQINGVSGFDKITAGTGAVITLKKIAADDWDLFGFLLEASS